MAFTSLLFDIVSHVYSKSDATSGSGKTGWLRRPSGRRWAFHEGGDALCPGTLETLPPIHSRSSSIPLKIHLSLSFLLPWQHFISFPAWTPNCHGSGAHQAFLNEGLSGAGNSDTKGESCKDAVVGGRGGWRREGAVAILVHKWDTYTLFTDLLAQPWLGSTLGHSMLIWSVKYLPSLSLCFPSGRVTGSMGTLDHLFPVLVSLAGQTHKIIKSGCSRTWWKPLWHL